MQTTIKDVARRAGVAVSTVSLVINGKAKVSEKTRKKVLRAIKELNYHPRRVARGLVTRHTGNIGFILTHDHFSQSEPFYTKIFLGTEFEARKLDYYILLTTVDREFHGRESIPRFLLERNVDGVIFAGTTPDALFWYVRDRVPHIFVDYYPKETKATAVVIDNFDGGYQAVSHLVQLGHRSIAFLGGEMDHPSLSERYEGYKKALADHGISYDTRLVVANEAYAGNEQGYRATCRLLEDGIKFTGVIAGNDAMAVGCIRCLRDHKINVPADVSIVGFDDIEAAVLSRPTLTTIRVPKEEMGALAARRLVEIIRGETAPIQKITVPIEIVIRESTGQGAPEHA